MRKGLLTLVAIAMINTLLASIAFGAPVVNNLKPGQIETLEQNIPINIVFVGYEQDSINEAALRAQLPSSYEPVVRYPQFYGLPGRPMGLRHTYSYNLIHTPARFDNAFFAYLREIGTPGEPTVYQGAYNEQASNVRDVEGPVLYIDAPSVELYLMQAGQRAFRINPDRSYTVYLINWHARPDFQFHVYTKTDDVDPDTGYNFGQERQDRKMIAWGGCYGRTWFYDLSAGPEAWTANFVVDEKDLDGNGLEDYRMPPIWEYVEGGYRAPTALSSDLGLVLRYVAINLLFTTSPLYDPLKTTPERHGDKIMHTALLEDDPSTKGAPFYDKERVLKDLYDFQPYYGWRSELEVIDPIDPAAARTLRIFTRLIDETDCWTVYGFRDAQLYCYFDTNRDTYFPSYRPIDYLVPIVAFNTDDATDNGYLPLGFADDNWQDGTQSYIFAFDTPTARDLGYGFTVTVVHEVGHHIGMSHPHDGYDSEHQLDYGPADEFFFAWSGDESATVMSYIDVNFSFGTFDRDNIYRWETAGYLNEANALIGAVLASPGAHKVERLVRQADVYASRAKTNFRRWDYADAVRNAYQSYLAARDAAAHTGIDLSTELTPATATARASGSKADVPWYVLDQHRDIRR